MKLESWDILEVGSTEFSNGYKVGCSHLREYSQTWTKSMSKYEQPKEKHSFKKLSDGGR